MPQSDAAHDNEGLDPEETRTYVAELVTKQLECEGFSLHPDQVGGWLAGWLGVCGWVGGCWGEVCLL